MMFGARARPLPPKPWNLRPCDPKPHQLRTKREGAHKVHILPNHGDRDHVDNDNDHQW